MVLYCKRVTFMAYFLKKTVNKKVLIFRFIQAFMIPNVVIPLINLTNLSAMFTNFRQKALMIPLHFTKKKLLNLTRNLMQLRMQKKSDRFQKILLKN